MQTQSGDSPENSKALKIAGIISTIIWIISFILLFLLKPTDKLVWTSDALLLAGFWPLLFVYKAGWTWLVFGCLNMFIGLSLEVSRHIPVDAIPQAYVKDYLAGKDHILGMHPTMPWLFNGAVSALYGLFRIIKTITKWCLKQKNKSRDNQAES